MHLLEISFCHFVIGYTVVKQSYGSNIVMGNTDGTCKVTNYKENLLSAMQYTYLLSCCIKNCKKENYYVISRAHIMHYTMTCFYK